MKRARKSEPAWVVVLAHAVSVQTVSFSARPAAAYVALERGMSPGVIGVLAAVFAIAPLCLAVVSGRVTDHLGERTSGVVGGALLLASCAMLLWGPATLWMLLSAVAMLGVGHLFSVIAEQTAVANTAGTNTDTAFGRYSVASSAGQLMGPLLIVGLGGSSSALAAGPVLLGSTCFALLGLGTGALLPRRKAVVVAPEFRGWKSDLNLLKIPSLWRAVLISGIVVAAIDISLVYLPALGAEMGVSAQFIGIALTARAVSSIAIRLTTGWLVRSIGRSRVIAIGLLISATAMASLALGLPEIGLIGVAIVLGAGLGICQPLTMSMAASAAPLGRRGAVMSMRVMSNRLGQVVVPGALGVLGSSAGSAPAFAVTGVLLLTAIPFTRSKP